MGKSMLMRFVLINAAVFLTVHIIALIANISDVNLPLATWIELPPDFITALKRPWTFITYMFTHYDVWHILFNLLWLYCFGIVFLDHFSEKDFSTAYFAGGFAGAVFYLTGNALFPQIYSHGLLGASAAVLSVATATVVRAPNYRINLLLIGPVKIKWIAVACVAIALLTAGNNNIGGHIAHIGGIVEGFIIGYGINLLVPSLGSIIGKYFALTAFPVWLVVVAAAAFALFIGCWTAIAATERPSST